MRIAFRILVLSSLALLASCGPPPPTETVQLTQLSPFDSPLDGRWRRLSQTRPIAFLVGRGETTRILGMRRAVLRISCHRWPNVWIAYDLGLGSGPIRVTYRFDSKTQQTGAVRVRGRTRNILKIDYSATAVAFQADLRTSSALTVRAQRAVFEMHDAHFRWDRNDKVLGEVVAACNAKTLEAARRNEPAPAKDDEDDEVDAEFGDVLR